MPTRIVIREQPSTPRFHSERSLQGEREQDGAQDSSSNVMVHRRSKTPIQGVVGLRSTMKKTEAKKSLLQPGVLANKMMQDKKTLHLSRYDLRASPRLPGYLYILVTSVVMLVSAVTFFVERESQAVEVSRRFLQGTSNGTAVEGDFDDSTEIIKGRVVLTWKLYGALVISAAGVGLSLLILWAHFDTICFPRLWKKVFRDGSKGEFYVLIGLFLFWAAGLHICTSSLSVGEIAPNVYFTTWIAFASTCINIGVWRTSAEQETLADKLWNHPRETIHNWFFVFVFSTINALAIADAYANREFTEYLINGQVQSIPEGTWMRAFGVCFGAMATSLITLACTHYFQGHARYGTICGCTINLDWRQPEGFIALCFVGVYTWIIIDYTGVNFPLSGPSNGYFGAWGVFFSSILTFGTWIRENKHIELIIDEGEEDSKEEEEEEHKSSRVVFESAREI